MRLYYTEKELKQILDSMVILVDTRENANGHIIDFFNSKKIKYKSKKLDYGDYSVMVPCNPELGIMKDTFFDDEIVIERKGSLTELSGNLTKDRERFEKELIRKKDAKFLLMVEDGSWEDIQSGAYNTQYTPASFYATLNAYIARFNITVNFVTKYYAPIFIYGILKYHLRERMLNFEGQDLEEGE